MTITANIDAIKTQSEGQASSIHNSGIYTITIKQAYIKATKNGAKKLWLAYKLKDSDKDGGVLFVSLTNNDGKDNFQKVILDKIITVLGLSSVNVVKGQVVTKKGTTEEDCIPALANQTVKVWVKVQFSSYNGQIQESANIQEVFRASDNASAKEIVMKSEVGKRYKSCEPAFRTNDYRDNLTEADIKAWREIERAKREGKPIPESAVKLDDEIPF